MLWGDEFFFFFFFVAVVRGPSYTVLGAWKGPHRFSFRFLA